MDPRGRKITLRGSSGEVAGTRVVSRGAAQHMYCTHTTISFTALGMLAGIQPCLVRCHSDTNNTVSHKASVSTERKHTHAATFYCVLAIALLHTTHTNAHLGGVVCLCQDHHQQLCYCPVDNCCHHCPPPPLPPRQVWLPRCVLSSVRGPPQGWSWGRRAAATAGGCALQC